MYIQSTYMKMQSALLVWLSTSGKPEEKQHFGGEPQPNLL